MRKSALSLAGFIVAAAMVAMAAANPSIEIQSPGQNSTLRGNAVIIKFRTHDFKVVSLRNMVTPGAAAHSPAAETGSAEAAGSAQPNPGMNGGMYPGGSMSPSSSMPAGGGMSPNAGTMPQDEGAAIPAISSVNPREGFVDVLVDNANFYFIHSTSDPILIAGLAPGPHKITLRLVTADHRPAGAEQTLNFTIAAQAGAAEAPQH